MSDFYKITEICGQTHKNYICQLPPRHLGNCINLIEGNSIVQCKKCDEWIQYNPDLNQTQLVCSSCGVIHGCEKNQL